EITTRNYRLTSAISFHLLRLSFLRTRIHIFWREQVPQLPLAFAKHSRVTGICRKVRCFIRVCFEIEELWRILHVMDVFECTVTDCKSARRGAHDTRLAPCDLAARLEQAVRSRYRDDPVRHAVGSADQRIRK